jgi:enamine deaminase RidA (YjgF/YER057c/UK114 family)
MRIPRSTLLLAGALLSLFPVAGQKKKDKEEATQILQLPKELPNAVAGDTHRLTFHVTPLSGKGLLSAQIREALKAAQHETGGETVLKIRAFVAGPADLRRVRDLVSESFNSRKQPLPALTLVRAGDLPLEGAQVAFEVVSETKKDVNPVGLAFVSPLVATADDPLSPVEPLTKQTLAGLRSSVQAIGSEPAGVLRVTCFVSSLKNVEASQSMVAAEYPHAAALFLQANRSPVRGLSACEAVVRLRQAPEGGEQFINPSGTALPGESQIALVNTPQVVLTGSQDSFGFQDRDARLAFERLIKSLEQAGASGKDIAFAQFYALSPSLANQVRKVRGDFFQKPAGTLLVFEGLPSMDAGFGIDAVAAK